MHYFIAGFIAAYVEKFGVKRAKKTLKCSGRHLKLALKGHAVLTLAEIYWAAQEFEKAKKDWMLNNPSKLRMSNVKQGDDKTVSIDVTAEPNPSTVEIVNEIL